MRASIFAGQWCAPNTNLSKLLEENNGHVEGEARSVDEDGDTAPVNGCQRKAV